MNWYDSSSDAFDAVEALAQRFSQFDVLVWRVGVGSNRWARLIEGHALGRVFDSPELAQEVLNAVANWAGDFVEVSEGILVSVLESDESEEVMTAAMVFTSSFSKASSLLELEVSGVDSPMQLADGISDLHRYDMAAAGSIVQAARWMLADLSRIEENHSAIHGFSRELMDAYEQIGVLYRIGKAMGNGTPPERFVAELCNELEQFTRFGWIATMFEESTGRMGSVAGQLENAKPSSARKEALVAALPGLLKRVEAKGSVILDPTSDAFAASISSELAVQPIGLGGVARGALVAGDKGGDDPGISSVDTQLLKAAAEFMSVFLDNARMYEDQRRLFWGTLQAMTSSIDAKDPYTCGHSERVSQLAVLLSEALGHDSAFTEDVRIAGLVHDVGKIGVPEAVLQKPDRLTREEYGLIQQHPEIGCRILKDVPQFSSILPGVLSHHERWDGKGYPMGLAGDAIPLIARVLGVADSFDAMSSTRSYRQAMSRETVLEEMGRCAGTQFDPELIPVFVKLDFAGYDETVRRHAEQYRLAA